MGLFCKRGVATKSIRNLTTLWYRKRNATDTAHKNIELHADLRMVGTELTNASSWDTFTQNPEYLIPTDMHISTTTKSSCSYE